MAKQNVTITVTFAYDPDEHRGMAHNVFLHTWLWETNLKVPIVGVEYKGVKRTFSEEDPMGNLPLRMADTLDEKRLEREIGPEAPEPAPENTVRDSRKDDQEPPTPLDFSKPPITVTHKDNGRTPADRE